MNSSSVRRTDNKVKIEEKIIFIDFLANLFSHTKVIKILIFTRHTSDGSTQLIIFSWKQKKSEKSSILAVCWIFHERKMKERK